jgi:hypothetical protein
MMVWSTVFASLGAAARNLLTSGVDFSSALSAVIEDAGEITEMVLAVAFIFGVLALVCYAIWTQLPFPRSDPEGGHEVQGRLPLQPKSKVEISARDDY